MSQGYLLLITSVCILLKLKSTKLSDNYENKKISTIDVNTQKIAKSFSSEEPIVQAKKIYFLENRVKKNFKN